jgi:hypothetical protein
MDVSRQRELSDYYYLKPSACVEFRELQQHAKAGQSRRKTNTTRSDYPLPRGISLDQMLNLQRDVGCSANRIIRQNVSPSWRRVEEADSQCKLPIRLVVTVDHLGHRG